ncbi:MAG: hypothetical protein JRZ95_05350 [Nitrososphaerota archaeon]|nr:hypothetical protein [Nitrososphaerota archaeon]
MYHRKSLLLIGILTVVVIFSSVQIANAVQYLPLWDKSGYKIGEYGTVTVQDYEQNTNMQIKNSIYVTVKSDSFTDGLTLHLLETEINSGVFSGQIRFSLDISAEDSIFVNENDFVHVVYRGYSNSAKIEPRTIFVSPITISADKNSYTFGEKIIISGKVADATPGSKIVLSVIDPAGKIIQTQSITLSYEQRFYAELTADSFPWEISGNYLVKVSSKSREAETVFSFSTTHHPEEITKSIKIFGSQQNLVYSITSGTVSLVMPNEDSNSLRFSLNTNSGGRFTVELPRTLIDAKTIYGEEDSFEVFSDDMKTEYVEKIGPNERTLTIPFSYKTKSIEIVGTQLEMTQTSSIKSSTYPVPSWIQNNAEWWSKGLIGEEDFLSGIQFLINQGIIQISTTHDTQQSSLPFVPNWVKDTAGWWAEGKVTDQDFLNGIKFLVENQIIKV